MPIKAKMVINCTYTNLNTFNRMLDLPAKKFKFDLTFIPIIKWRDENPPCITIMDGPFTTFHLENRVIICLPLSIVYLIQWLARCILTNGII